MFKFNKLFQSTFLNKQTNLFKTNKFNFRNTIKDRFGLSTKLRETASSQNLGLLLMGISVGGFSYIFYQNHKRVEEYQRSLLSRMSAPSKQTTERLKSTMLYFAGGLTTTSAIVAYMMRNPRVINMSMSLASLLITIPGLIICGYGMRATPNDSTANNVKKHVFWLGLNALMAFSICPIIAFSELKMVGDAFLLTSGAFGGLGLVAWNSHDTAFLGMSGILGAGFGTLFAVSLANLFFQSHALYNFWLYGGLGLFLALTLYDMKNVQVRAQRAYFFDPMSESISIYYDFINVFIRLLLIMQNRKNNK